MVLKQSSLCLPFSPQTSAGRAKAGSGVRATPPAAIKLAFFPTTNFFISGNTPIEPGNAS